MTEEKTSVLSVADLLGSARKQSAYLIVISAKSPAPIGKMHKLERAETVLGRSTDADIQVEDDGISRKHVKLVLAASGQYELVDLGSTNGTFVNGNKVSSVPLRDGDKIQLGTNTVIKFSLQDELEEQYQRSIYESAVRDGLTRIYNKKYFLDTLRKEFAYCVRHRVPLSLVLLDIDHFKKINDTYGHPAGDFILQRVAQRITDTVRTEDVFARYGGEEFALMLRESTEEQSLVCAERCRKAVDSADFSFAGTPIKVTISLGVAVLGDSDFTQAEELISLADKYLYRAKRAGRNRVDGRAISGT
jgi:two-component system cell cycle response regulator